MGNFQAALLRLKEHLGLETDKEVAELLGMTVKAFTARKARDSFPEEKLRALAQRRPDLPIDVDYVLTGETVRMRYEREYQRPPASIQELTSYAMRDALAPDERDLLDLFRAASLEQKMKAVAILSAKPKPPSPSQGIKVSGRGNRVAGRDYNETKE